MTSFFERKRALYQLCQVYFCSKSWALRSADFDWRKYLDSKTLLIAVGTTYSQSERQESFLIDFSI